MIKRKFSNDIDNLFEEDSLNPMDSVGNLADAMLVLAVGIMLSLVMAWNVDIGNKSADVTKIEKAAVIKDDELAIDNTKNPDDEIGNLGLSEYGKVYVDENGDMYVLKNEDK